MEAALFGLVGLIAGILLNEYFRRRRRIEAFGEKIFDKRLEIYEEFHQKLSGSMEIASDIIENPNYSQEERHEIWSEVMFDIAKFADTNELYLNEDITLHCLTTLMGVEEIYAVEDDAEKQTIVKDLHKKMSSGRQMIRKEIGLHELDKLFKTLTKAKHKSDIIDYANELRKKYKNEHR